MTRLLGCYCAPDLYLHQRRQFKALKIYLERQPVHCVEWTRTDLLKEQLWNVLVYIAKKKGFLINVIFVRTCTPVNLFSNCIILF